jgi:hypothetical protein
MRALEAVTGLKGLQADHFPHGPVTVSMQDGSFFCWFGAFYICFEESVFVYTEHYGYHQFEHEMINAFFGPNEPAERRRTRA